MDGETASCGLGPQRQGAYSSGDDGRCYVGIDDRDYLPIGQTERPINFSRDRWMLCGQCGHRWPVNLEWIERWEQSQERCPGCGINCEEEISPRVTIDPEDVALADEAPLQLIWYHTTTCADWPSMGFDPAKGLTDLARRRMGGEARVQAWADRHRNKALHVGTYEAAIHNMFRRCADQGDQGEQFYLNRVFLKPSAVVDEGWLTDPSNFVGGRLSG